MGLNKLIFLFLTVLLLSFSSVGWAEDTVCIQCHSGQEDDYLNEPVRLWHNSVHQQNNISCHNCHGGDPTDFETAMAPDSGFLGAPDPNDIPAFCGRCHVGVKDDYLKSAHGQALGRGGPQCVTCHSNHEVQKASLTLIAPELCSQCHGYGRAAEIKKAVTAIDEQINSLEGSLKPLRKNGISTQEMAGSIFSLRNEFHRIFHSVDVQTIVQQTDDFQRRLSLIEDKITKINDTLSRRKIFGAVAISLLLICSCLLFQLSKTYRVKK